VLGPSITWVMPHYEDKNMAAEGSVTPHAPCTQVLFSEGNICRDVGQVCGTKKSQTREQLSLNPSLLKD
jgi:hypothetical protein